MSSKKLGQFNPVTSIDENYHVPLLKQNTDNYIILPSNLGKSTSKWSSSTTSITAYAGGGQTNATALTTKFNKVTTVATTADSVKCFAALEGNDIYVTNAGANALDLFPLLGDNFDGAAVNVATSITAGTTKQFHCFVDGTWTEI